MMSMHKPNIPFDVLERHKCVNLRNVCPSRKVLGFSEFSGGGFDKGKGKFRRVETPVGAMLWDI